jgi:putative Mg2+ transporter-C (MgtC) family protein
VGDLSQWEAVERIVVALIAGAAIGFEREWSGKAAGIRTHALVAEGAALFMIASLLLGGEVWAAGHDYDPSRLASTVVQGIGFIAAGVIIRHNAQIRGLTTAAGLWVAAAIGLLVGAGFYVIAFSAVAATLVALSLLRFFDLDATDSEPGRTNRRSSPRRWPRARLSRIEAEPPADDKSRSD